MGQACPKPSLTQPFRKFETIKTLNELQLPQGGAGTIIYHTCGGNKLANLAELKENNVNDRCSYFVPFIDSRSEQAYNMPANTYQKEGDECYDQYSESKTQPPDMKLKFACSAGTPKGYDDKMVKQVI